VSFAEGGHVIGFKAGERCIEHFPARHDDDVETVRNLVAPKQLAGEAFGAVSYHGRPEFPRGSHPQSRPSASIGYHKQHHESAVNPDAGGVGSLELRAAPNPICTTQALWARSPRLVARAHELILRQKL
jgi:hypothetical protein